MSRRSQRRKPARRSSAGRGGGAKWTYRILSILVLAVILAGFGGYFWLKSYLHSDDFRVFLGETVGDAIGAEAQFELFEWQGMQARTEGFSSENGDLIRGMRADGIEAKVNLSGVRRGVWEVSGLRVKQLDLDLDTRSAKNEDAAAEPENDPTPVTDPGDEVGFLASLLPNRAELSSAQIERLNLNLETKAGHLEASNLIARIDAASADGAYDVNLSDGLIETTWFGSPLELDSARGKYQDGRIYITESRSKVYERGLLDFSGEINGGEFGFYGNLRDVRVEELVPPDWQKRLTGNLTTEFKVQSGRAQSDGTLGATIVRGELELKRGVLESLPVLDRIAAYANSRRFRRLDFSEAKLKYRKEGDRLELTEIVLATEGLVRIEGEMTLVDGRVDGRFKVGITPGTLAHIPGAETKVFLRGDKGLLWAPLRITGTVDAPKEDLSDRMIAAAGERMFELVPETGKMALKFAHDTATQLPEKTAETGADALKTGVEAVQKGLEEGPAAGIEQGVRGIFDLIPGAPRQPREEPEKKEDKDKLEEDLEKTKR
ncbi:hypothetical protein NT6N_32420 [Oceaniferula spumae]|uniref:AsmA-like C-terminal domain-containing protein n=1 Tax=Oceaniferula spumae TaxID=2979115 RepID=A0AAT9FQD8_9BACT